MKHFLKQSVGGFSGVDNKSAKILQLPEENFFSKLVEECSITDDLLVLKMDKMNFN